MTKFIKYFKENTFLNSIRLRLVLWFSSILVLVLFLFSTFIYYIQARDLRKDSQEQLDNRMVTLKQGLEHLLAESNANITIPAEYFQENDISILLEENGQVIYQRGITSPQKIILQANSNINSIQVQEEAPSKFVSWVGLKGSEYQDYNFVIAPIDIKSKKLLYIILATPYDIYGQLGHLTTNLLLGSLLTLLIALAGGIWLADRAMRPVKTITQAAHRISETDLSYRLNLKGDDELSHLAKTFDEMLSRLQSSFERQRQFVADASHELRTPITIINLQTNHALATDRSKNEYKKAFNIIQIENNFMARMVNDLLMLARIDSGQANFQKKPLDLSEIIMDVVEHLLPLAKNRKIRLEIGDLKQMFIMGDSQSIFQMVNNLVENGIKYNTCENGFVRIELEKLDDCIRLIVFDNGPGIPYEHLPHIFDRFYRVDEARSHDRIDGSASIQSEGRGLGLSIAQWIAQNHGGEIKVESEPGHGTCFEIKIPIIKNE